MYIIFIFLFISPSLSLSIFLVICATVMWVSECCPLFVTSMVVIVFGALTGVLLDEKGNILEPEAAASKIFTKLYPSSVPLVLAGFSISAAFKKYKIDMLIANFILGSRFFRTPARFVAAVEFLCFFMSMWVSNVAASVLTLTVIMPIIRDLPDNCMYVRTLLMATAVSGNVGGMTTQIASPQNSVTVSLGEYSVGFVEFIGASILICPFLLVTGHFLVMYLYKPDIEVLPGLDDSASAGAGAEPESSVQATAATLRAVQDSQKTAPELPFYKRIDLRVLATAIITLLSIVLWVASNWLKPFGCNIGLISFVPLCLFYGSGLLTKEDFEALPWNLPMLLAGGNILGYAVESSKLLSMVSGLLENLPNNTFVLVVVCGFIMMIAGSFVSHTVAALILLNLFAEVGTFVGHPKLLVMTSVIVCSGAMPLPVSSFPNLNAISLCDQNGNSYLKTVDFLKVGITQTVVAYIFSCTITYGMSLLIGF